MRPLKLDQLKTFLEVAKLGSFTAAARVLNLSQPAITHQIRDLEQHLQVALFERTGNRVSLTAAGGKLAEHARPLIEQDFLTRAAIRKFVDDLVQRVRIGTSMTALLYILPPVLRRLKSDSPQLEIILKTGLTRTTLQLLKEQELDLGLCAMPIKDAGFDTVPLFTEKLVAIMPAQLGALPATITPAFLSRCPLILCSKESALGRTATEWLALGGQAPKPVMEFEYVEAIKSAVAIGLGSSIVPSSSVNKLDDGMNIAVRPISPSMSRQTGLVMLRGKQGTDAVSTAAKGLLTLQQRAATR